MKTVDVAIVGAGIAGLALAWKLKRLRPEISLALLDSAPRGGGLIGTARREGFQVELGPAGVLDDKPEFVALCQELELELFRAAPAAADRFLFLGDKLRRLPATPGEFLRSDILSARGRMRFVAERLLGRASGLADESIRDFGIRHFGTEAADVLLDTVVTGIYAGDPSRLSFPSCFPRLAALEKEHGSLLKAQMILARDRKAQARSAQARSAGEGSAVQARNASPLGGVMATPKGGMGTLVEALAQRLAPDLQTDVQIESIAPADSGWDLTLRGDEPTRAAKLALAAPAYRMAPLVRPWNPALADLLAGIEAASVAVCAVGYRREDLATVPTGFGYLAPERLERPVLGAIYSSSIFPEQAPADGVQIRAILGGWRRPEVAGWPEEQLIGAVRADLKTALGIVAEPIFTECVRWERAIPQYFVGHQDRLAKIAAASPPGLYFLGASYRGVAVADCVNDAGQVASAVLAAPMNPAVPAG